MVIKNVRLCIFYINNTIPFYFHTAVKAPALSTQCSQVYLLYSYAVRSLSIFIEPNSESYVLIVQKSIVTELISIQDRTLGSSVPSPSQVAAVF